MPESHLSISSSISSSTFELPADVSGKSVEDNPSAWSPATEAETQKELQVPWLLLGPSLGTAATWGVNKQMEACSLSLFKTQFLESIISSAMLQSLFL